jgi:hypothetical protein
MVNAVLGGREFDVRLYVPDGSGGWMRARLPDFQVTGLDWEIVSTGGFGEGHVTLSAEWEDYAFAGNERVDIWDGPGANLLYRGDVRLPASKIAIPETVELALYGHRAACVDWLVGRRYVYGELTDLATVATDLYNDCVQSNEASALSDLQMTGAYVQPGQILDWSSSSLAAAMDSLIALAPDMAYWGWDTAAGSGRIPVNRIYMRPRAASRKYDYVVGGTVSAFDQPIDCTQIVNSIHITGGPTAQPNLCANGGFEHPVAPSETDGNLLQNPGFEDPQVTIVSGFLVSITETSESAPWELQNDASLKSVSDTGGGNAFPQEGKYWCSLDQDTETVQQLVSVDLAKPLQGSVWIRRGTDGTAATCSVYVDALDSGGSVLGSVGYSGNPFDPSSLPTYIADTIYQRLVWDADLSSFTECVAARLRIVAHSGTNDNDGVFVDNAGLWYRGQMAQTSWLVTQSGPNSEPSGPTSVAPLVDWTRKSSPAPLRGGYCIHVEADPVSSGWQEIQQRDKASFAGLTFHVYSLSAWIQADTGDTADVTIGAYAYQSDGSLWAVMESDHYSVAGDGSWYSAWATITIGSGDAKIQPFIRIYSTCGVSFDCLMAVQGGPPTECVGGGSGQRNFWEGANYEWDVDVTDTSLGLSAALADSIATYGLRRKVVSQPLVIDRPSAVAVAAGYFQANGLPAIQSTLTIADDERPVGLDGFVRVHGLGGEAGGGRPADQPLMPVRIRWAYSGSGVVCDVSLNNRKPDMASLFLQQAAKQSSQVTTFV